MPLLKSLKDLLTGEDKDATQSAPHSGEPEAQADPVDSRRTEKRISLPQDMSLVAALNALENQNRADAPDSQPVEAVVRDISLHGLGMMIRDDQAGGDLPPEQHVRIALPDGRNIEGSMLVRHQKRNSDGAVIGGKFTPYDSNQHDALETLVEWLSAEQEERSSELSEQTRRRSERRAIQPHHPISAQHADRAVADSAITLADVSESGLGLLIDGNIELKAGDWLRNIHIGYGMEPDANAAPSGAAQTLTGDLEIHHVAHSGEHTRLGGTFHPHAEQADDPLADLYAWLQEPDDA